MTILVDIPQHSMVVVPQWLLSSANGWYPPVLLIRLELFSGPAVVGYPLVVAMTRVWINHYKAWVVVLSSLCLRWCCRCLLVFVVTRLQLFATVQDDKIASNIKNLPAGQWPLVKGFDSDLYFTKLIELDATENWQRLTGTWPLLAGADVFQLGPRHNPRVSQHAMKRLPHPTRASLERITGEPPTALATANCDTNTILIIY